jgi:acetyltransferase-like isoleucine patch superfamily enzyme
MSMKDIGFKPLSYGSNFNVVMPSNVYGAVFGDDVFVGPFTEIQSEVHIGDRTRIQSHTFICSLVTIGEDCFIGHGVMFINDLFKEGHPSRGDKNKWQRTDIGNQVSIGSNATILPVKITNNVVIGAGSVVTKDIHRSGIYVGNPAVLIREI